MQQVKLFKGVESDMTDLERRVNDFIREENVQVVSLTGNIAPRSASEENHKLGKGYTPSDVLMILLYEVADA